MNNFPLKKEHEVTMSSYVAGRASWLSRKGATILFVVLLSVFCLFGFFQRPDLVTAVPSTLSHKISETLAADECTGNEDVVSRKLWHESQSKYKGLSDEKFTMAIQTYKRPEELNSTLELVLSVEIPSLEEVIIVWNDLETEPPQNFVSDFNVAVRYRVSQRNSLTSKFWPDPDFRTKAILFSDDDVHYDPKDLDFIFQQWRKNQRRLVGGFARCIEYNPDQELEYCFCRDRDWYSIILTGLAFINIEFIDYFSSEDPLMTKIRDYVDDKFNCEDIAMNFMVSALTCNAPLQVAGLSRPVNEKPPSGISTEPDHFSNRHLCVREFTEMFGYIPLQNSTEYITRGSFIDNL